MTDKVNNILFEYCLDTHGSLLICIQDTECNPVDITGNTYRVHIRKNINKPAMKNNGFMNEVIAGDVIATEGKFHVEFTEAQECKLSIGSYYIEVEHLDSGIWTSVITGRIKFTRSQLKRAS